MSDIVERLRKDAELSLDGCGFAELVELEREAADEIERLRSELDACGACIKRADAEIKRLRELRDTILKGEVAIRRRDADEIERLRGLLREALLPPVRLRVIPQGEDWIKRVREALGE